MEEATHAEGTLDALITETRAALRELGVRIEPLIAEQKLLQDRLSALEHVRSLYSEGTTTADPTEDRPSQQPAVTGTVTALRPVGGSVSDRVRSHVRELLASADAPMHILDIHQAFKTRGWAIPGAGVAANITAHLSKAPDIYSPKRGFWALGDNPNVKRTGKAQQRRTKKRAGKKTTTTGSSK